MTLKQAIKELGGPVHAATATKLPRTTLLYWLKGKAPKWRAADIERIIALAEQKKAA